MERFASNTDLFVQSLFTSQVLTAKAATITFIYLQQILGPSLKDWNIPQPVYIDEMNDNLVTIEMARNPNIWTDRYIDSSTDSLKNMFQFDAWSTKQLLLPPLSKRAKKNIMKSRNPILKLGMPKLQRRSKDESDLFLCKRRADLINSVKDHNPDRFLSWWVPHSAPTNELWWLPMTTKYSTSYVLEYVLHPNSPVVILAELHEGQYEYVQAVGREYNVCTCTSASCRKHMTTTRYNQMLDYLLYSVGRDKIVLLRQTINDNTTSTARISLLASDKVPDNKSLKVTGNIHKLTVDNTLHGDLDDKGGLVIQHIFECPVNNVGITLRHVKLVEETFKKGTPRTSTNIKGLYQNIGARSTAQCSASLGAHPDTKQSHDYWNWQMNPSVMPPMMKMRNNLRHLTSITIHSCGSIPSLALKASTRLELHEIHQTCLFTSDKIFNTRHKDVGDFMSKDESDMVINTLESSGNVACKRYIEKLQKVVWKHGSASHGLVPMETGCFWTLPRQNEYYDMRQGLANFTAGTILDLSSYAFKKTKVIGSVFLGSTIEHCTTHPIWIRKSDNTVRFTPPPETPHNYPFAC